jgi:hypothetical protein
LSQDAIKLLEDAKRFVREMNESGLFVRDLERLLQELEQAFSSTSFSTLKTKFEELKLNYDSAMESLELRDSLRIDIAEADPQATVITDTAYTVTSNALAPGASQQIALTLPAMCMVRSVVSNFPARVRVYLTTAYATADASRLITADPIGDHGCLLEVSSNTNNWSVQCAPPVYIYRLPTETTVVVLIDNTSATTNTYTVNFNTYKW